MASLLMQLLFASPELEQQGPQCLQQKDCDTGQHQLCLAACFTSHFCFPCKAQTFSTTEQKVVQDFENQAQVLRAGCFDSCVSSCCTACLLELQPGLQVIMEVAHPAFFVAADLRHVAVCAALFSSLPTPVSMAP